MSLREIVVIVKNGPHLNRCNIPCDNIPVDGEYKYNDEIKAKIWEYLGKVVIHNHKKAVDDPVEHNCHFCGESFKKIALIADMLSACNKCHLKMEKYFDEYKKDQDDAGGNVSEAKNQSA